MSVRFDAVKSLVDAKNYVLIATDELGHVRSFADGDLGELYDAVTDVRKGMYQEMLKQAKG